MFQSHVAAKKPALLPENFPWHEMPCVPTHELTHFGPRLPSKNRHSAQDNNQHIPVGLPYGGYNKSTRSLAYRNGRYWNPSGR